MPWQHGRHRDEGSVIRLRTRGLVRFLVLLLALITAGSLAGCAHLTDSVLLSPNQSEHEIGGSHSVGQTFVCHHAGLDGISVLLRGQPGGSDVVLRLRESPDSQVDIAAAAVSPRVEQGLTLYRFEIPLQDDVNGRSFHLLIESAGGDSDVAAIVPYSPDETSNLTLYLDGVAVQGNLSFKLHYNSLYIVKDLGRQAVADGGRTLWLLLLSLMLYLLPGGVLVVWLLKDGDWIERFVVAGGLSVAIHVFLLYVTMTGLRLNSATVIGFLLLCACLIAARWWLDLRRTPKHSGSVHEWVQRQLCALRQDPFYCVLGIVVLLVLGVRVWVMRDMVAPRWGDSYQHVVISQLMIDHGGIFESWAPYAPYNGLTMHFGFHANAAMFHWLSGAGALQAVIWTGQMLNVLAVLALYPLGKRTGGRWCGLLAVMVGGLLTATPMVYVNWGRYPQLTGLVLLPVAVWLSWRTLDGARLDGRLFPMTVLATAGQLPAYYRMPYYYAILLGALLLSVYLPVLKFQWRQWGRLLLRVAMIGAAVALVLLPWGLHISQSHLADSLVQGISRGRNIDRVRAEYAQWRLIALYVPVPILAAAAVALLWAVVRKSTKVLAIGVWSVGLFATFALRLVGLPGTKSLNAFSAIISMYAPVSLLVGWLGAQVAKYAGDRWTKWGRYAFAGGAILLSLFGARASATLSDPGYDLVRTTDLEAMSWIREHTSSSARFLVNGFLVYNGTSIVGSDAGWWIPFFTGRTNTVPPQYALVNERETEPGYGDRLVKLVAQLQNTPLPTPGGLELLCEEGITHVYVGQGEGRVGATSPSPLFVAADMLSSPAFEAEYHRDRVWVFALSDGVCSR